MHRQRMQHLVVVGGGDVPVSVVVGGNPAVDQDVFRVVNGGDAVETPLRHLEIVFRAPPGSTEHVVIENPTLAPPTPAARKSRGREEGGRTT